MNRPTAVLLLIMLALAVGGCATSPGTSSSSSASPSVRCLSDPNERGTRPLIFLFCIQSP